MGGDAIPESMTTGTGTGGGNGGGEGGGGHGGGDGGGGDGGGGDGAKPRTDRTCVLLAERNVTPLIHVTLGQSVMPSICCWAAVASSTVLNSILYRTITDPEC